MGFSSTLVKSTWDN
uniref:Uncharacterized protein n=1 Tax=Arundo donax TaxID=35708 RepID=A0A0A9EQW1_ARUDO